MSRGVQGRTKQCATPSDTLSLLCSTWHAATRCLFLRHGGRGGLQIARSHIPKVAQFCEEKRKMGSQSRDQKWFPKW